MIELRWAESLSSSRRLQWRVREIGVDIFGSVRPQQWGEWQDVPTIIVVPDLPKTEG